MSNRASTPFPIYNDSDGSPLDAGFIFFGQMNKNPLVSPIAIFFDAALTMPAENPVRTRNGFIVRNGAPRQIFCAEPIISIAVQNKRKENVWNLANINLNPGVTPEAVIDPTSGESQAEINADTLRISSNLEDLNSAEQARDNLGVYSKEQTDTKIGEKIIDATDEKKGIIRIANDTEAADLTNDTAALTPKKVPKSIAKLLTAAGDAPIFGVRSYGCFSDSAEIITGGNFKSVTRISEGLFEVTLDVAMSNAKYLVIPSRSINDENSANSVCIDESFTQTATKFRLICTYGGDNNEGRIDPATIGFIVLG